jgi:hypothetical protein
MSKQTINEQLDELVLCALRNGASVEDMFQLLTGKAAWLSNTLPVVNAVLDSRATGGGNYL